MKSSKSEPVEVEVRLDAEVVEQLRMLGRRCERAGAKIDALLERSRDARLLLCLQRIERRAMGDVAVWTSHLGNHAAGRAPDTRGAVALEREKRRRAWAR